MFAKVGSSRAHNQISGNPYLRLRTHLRGGPFETYISDVKVRVPTKHAYYYPDIVVTCDSRERPMNEELFLVSAPTLIVDVLSSSTEATDRREKLLAFQTLDSLREYVLVAQAHQRVETYRRTQSGWEKESLEPCDPVRFVGVDLTLTFADVYEGSGVPLRAPDQE